MAANVASGVCTIKLGQFSRGADTNSHVAFSPESLSGQPPWCPAVLVRGGDSTGWGGVRWILAAV